MSKKSIYSVDVDRNAAFAGEVPELTAEFFRTAQVRHGDKILREGTFTRSVRKDSGRSGVPGQADGSKVEHLVPLSPEVLKHLRATGPGWLARIDEILLRHVRDLGAR